jgi:prevent-host-death family protein
MKIAAVSEFKAKLAKYLRLVKAGEKIEIHERGVPIAVVSAKEDRSNLTVVPPRKDPSRLAAYKFSVKPKKRFDIVSLLEQDRAKR